MIAATALMVKDANKLAMGQELQVTTPHAVEGILRQPPDRWLSNVRLTHYQGLLLNPLRITFKPPTTLNPASLLPDPDLSKPLHNCAEILAQVQGVREDLQDRPLPDADLTWFTDGSSFVHQGQRKLAIVHCPGHQKATNPVTRGNNLADQTAKDVAKTTPQLLTLQLPDPGPRELPFHPEYSEEDLQWISKLPGTQIHFQDGQKLSRQRKKLHRL
ncbi:uncharacterized protein LOC117074437 [Trachypithecus francoisi]|uniref:uncharacterized protein LOC117074437 n=1 Tax=Trachypithecus francoisi TaxID=54180 RepID=UPI00141AC157|nr:uncharacterized protein LOC117074437 [Trachypithecus francoisi]